jgi:hypothetical protein
MSERVGVFDLDQERHWVCPNCEHTRVTRGIGRQVVIHTCRGLRGLIAPLVQNGVKCKIVARVREDYVGREHVQVDGEGRPIMSVVTIRDDGQDCRVLAPVVVGRQAEVM